MDSWHHQNKFTFVEEAIDRFASNGQMVIVDPAMADDGRLYSIYTPDMVVAMRQLVSKAHIVKPNYTEACFLLDIPSQQILLAR